MMELIPTREHNFGTVTHDRKLKAAYLAAKTLASALNGYRIEKRLDLGSKNDFTFKLTKSENQAIAFWTMGEEHSITLPIDTGQGMHIDILGSKTSLR